MNLIYLLIASLISTTTVYAQNYQWAQSFGSNERDKGLAIAVDGAGNVFTTGFYQETADFDPGTGVDNHTAVGNVDIFVQKMDSSGNYLWARSFGSTGTEYGQAISTDADGNVYTTGFFKNTTDFDPGPGVANFTSLGNDDIFIQKMDADGNFLWVRTFGSQYFDEGFGITVDAAGNVYTTGVFRGIIDFDPGPGTTSLTSNGDSDVFVQKMDPSGNLIWVKSFGGTSGDRGISITTDAGGNVYTTGVFKSTVDFDPGSGTTSLSSSGVYDVFVQKMDASGNFIWAKSFGSTHADWGKAISLDDDGNVYVTGYFQQTVDFDPGTGTASFTASGEEDIYVQKMDPAGNFLWAKTFGGLYSDWSNAIGIDASGNVYTTGYFSVEVDFDPGPEVFELWNANTGGIFIQKMDPSGNFLWAGRLGGINTDDEAFGLTIDAMNNIHLTGGFQSGGDFDPGPAMANLVNTGNYEDIFVLKLSECVPVSTSINVSQCNSYTSPSGSFLWTASGIYTDTVPNVYGCDSVITIELEIIPVDTSVGVTANALFSNATNATYQWIDCDGNVPLSGETSNTLTPATTGTYAVVVEQGGCTDTSSCIPFEVTGCLAFYSLYPDPQITHNWFALDSSQGVAPITYDWDWGDGSTSTGMSISHTYDSAGYYNICLTITDAVGCTDSYCDNSTYIYKTLQMITVHVVSELLVGITEDRKSNPISFFPNPTSGELIIDLASISNEVTINAYNVLGNLVQTETRMTNGPIDYNMPEEKGIYVIQLIYSNGKVSNFKVVKD